MMYNLIYTQATYGSIVRFDKEKSNIIYSLSCLGITIKKKALPLTGELNIDKSNSVEAHSNALLLKGLDLNVKFTSHNPIFRKAIDYDTYPDFKFWTDLETPIILNTNEFIELEGYISFHGVTKKVKIKLKNNLKDSCISLTGFFSIEMTDFGIEPPKILFVRLDKTIKVKIELYTENTKI